MRRVMSGMDCGTSSGIINEFDDDGFERRTQENRRSKKEHHICIRFRQTGASKHFGVLERCLLVRIYFVFYNSVHSVHPSRRNIKSTRWLFGIDLIKCGRSFIYDAETLKV